MMRLLLHLSQMQRILESFAAVRAYAAPLLQLLAFLVNLLVPPGRIHSQGLNPLLLHIDHFVLHGDHVLE